MTPPRRLIPDPVVGDRTGLSRTTRWRLIQKGTFPRGVRIGGRTLWAEDEITAWIEARLTERDAQAQAQAAARAGLEETGA